MSSRRRSSRRTCKDGPFEVGQSSRSETECAACYRLQRFGKISILCACCAAEAMIPEEFAAMQKEAYGEEAELDAAKGLIFK